MSRHGNDFSRHPMVGKAGMADYRAYTVGLDGRFIGYEPLVCADDAEAIEKLKQLVDGHAMELWSGERLVTKLEPRQDQNTW